MNVAKPKMNVFVPNIETAEMMTKKIEGRNDYDVNIVILEHDAALKLFLAMNEHGQCSITSLTDSTYMMPQSNQFVDDGIKNLPDSVRKQYSDRLVGKKFVAKKGNCTVTSIVTAPNKMKVLSVVDENKQPIQVSMLNKEQSFSKSLTATFQEVKDLGKLGIPSTHLNVWSTAKDVETGYTMDDSIREHAYKDGMTVKPKAKKKVVTVV